MMQVSNFLENEILLTVLSTKKQEKNIANGQGNFDFTWKKLIWKFYSLSNEVFL